MQWRLVAVVISVFAYTQLFLVSPDLNSWVVGEVCDECVAAVAI